MKKLLGIPTDFRVISLLPVGVSKMDFSKDRRKASEFVYLDKFGRK